MSTVFVLDTGVVLGFQKAAQLAVLVQASQKVPLILIEEMYDEIVRPRNNKHSEQARQAKELFQASAFMVVSLDVDGSEAAILAKLRGGKASPSDMGEAASIAYAYSHEECIFVTNDAAAALQALTELRGRTMAFFPFVAELVRASAMDENDARRLSTTIPALRDWRATVPTWWPY